MTQGGDEWGDRPLSNHVLFRSADLDCARDMVAQKFCRHRLEMAGGGRFHAVQHHRPGRLVSLNFIAYGADVMIDPGALETFYLVQIPISGAATIRHHREEFVSNCGRAALLNADRETVMHWWAGCEQVLLQIPKAGFVAFAERQMDRRLPGASISPIRRCGRGGCSSPRCSAPPMTRADRRAVRRQAARSPPLSPRSASSKRC